MSLFQCEKCGAKENTAMVAEFLGLDDSLFCRESLLPTNMAIWYIKPNTELNVRHPTRL